MGSIRASAYGNRDSGNFRRKSLKPSKYLRRPECLLDFSITTFLNHSLEHRIELNLDFLVGHLMMRTA